jgi:hypothetical protein
VGEQIEMLKYHTKFLTNLVKLFFLVPYSFAFDVNLAILGLLEEVHTTQESTLSTPGGSDYNDHFTFLHAEGYVLENMKFSVKFIQFLYT